MGNFINSADSRETSIEIMEAISEISENEEQAVEIWEGDFDNGLATFEDVIVDIWEKVTKNGLLYSTDFCWGTEGDQWFLITLEKLNNNDALKARGKMLSDDGAGMQLWEFESKVANRYADDEEKEILWSDAIRGWGYTPDYAVQ